MLASADRHAEARAGGGGTAPPRYRLAAHVHVCVTGDGSVVLDLKRNKYLGLAKAPTEILAATVHDWPVPSWRRVLEDENQIKGGVCSSMLQRGLIVEEGSLERPPCADIHSASVRIDMRAPFVSIGDELEVTASIRAQHVLRFARSYIWAVGAMRPGALEATVAAVRARKGSGLESGAQWDLLRIINLVAVFRHLRPYVFGPEGRCLLHALTLVKFLSAHDVYPEWVIGVATQPWGAHSWVQWGNYLLDTNPEKVCRFTPILVV
jgi:Transglutaminase-like superfamily